MRMVIVDDEDLARERLRRLVSELPGYEIVGEAADGEAALDVIENEEPDVVLLDIRMGAVDGLNVARSIMEYDPPPAIIFTTAYSEHALSAFDVSAAGYLLKPIRLDKLRDALTRARRPTRVHRPPRKGENENGRREFVLAATRDGLQRIPIDDVIHFVADQKYTTVRHLHGEVLIEEALKTLEDDLGRKFLRIHRNALVATRFIVGLERDRNGDEQLWLRMKHVATPLAVSRRRVADVRRFLMDRE